MAISKQELYGVFLKNYNNRLVVWDLIPFEEISSLEKVEDSKDKLNVPITDEISLEKKEKDKSLSKKISLEVLFQYSKEKESITLVGNQITSVLGYPSSSLYFKVKDMKDVTKVNSSYEFIVKDSYYKWKISLSTRVMNEKEKEENTDETDTKNRNIR